MRNPMPGTHIEVCSGCQLAATSTPCPFAHCRKGGKLQCRAMHMLRTCVSSILLVNLPRNEMARSTAASAGQYVRSNDKNTPNIHPLEMLPLRRQGLPHPGHGGLGKGLNDMLLEGFPLFQCTSSINMRSCQFSVVCAHELLQQIHSKCSLISRW